MKRKYGIGTARRIIKCLMAFAGLVCIAALIFGDELPNLGGTALLIAAVCIVLCFIVLATGMKCPFCGRVIVRNALVAKSCPHCGRDLVTGEKTKKKR